LFFSKNWATAQISIAAPNLRLKTEAIEKASFNNNAVQSFTLTAKAK